MVYVNGIAFLDHKINVIKSYYSYSYSNNISTAYYKKSLDNKFIPKDTFLVEYHIRTDSTDLGWVSSYDDGLRVIPLYSSNIEQ